MSFRFNFTQDEDDSIESSSVDKKDEIKWLSSDEIFPCNQIKQFDEKLMRAKMYTFGETEIGHIDINEAIASITENDSKLVKEKNCDLVTGVYEGGLKIWECTNDMIQFLVENENNIPIIGKKVLDLGCGAGILGIYAFLKGAEVTFQDYNKEVLEYITIPNVILNIEDEDSREQQLKKCRFFFGDWGSFNLKLKDTFDIILTSETIYNESNYEKLINIFMEKLDANGAIYVAAKTCYFGVGGGIRQFEKSLDIKLFDCEVCWKNTQGIQREILKITKKIH